MITDILKREKNFILCFLSVALLVGCLLIYYGTYENFSKTKRRTVTIGVFSDSYWNVQNGYSYRILDDAIKFLKNRIQI